MRVHIELYSYLSSYLPPASRRHRASIEVAEETTPESVLRQYRVPPELAHLVVVNGLYVPPEDRSERRLEEGDVLAVWPARG
jgi:sulfur carrier protein ThiS